MRILDENNVEIVSPDFALGRLVPDTLLIAHHDAIEAVAEQWHYETVKTYPNGGKDVAKVIDVPGVDPQEAWNEYEDILRYILYTPEELEEIERKRKEEEVNRPVTWAELDAAYQEGVDSV